MPISVLCRIRWPASSIQATIMGNVNENIPVQLDGKLPLNYCCWTTYYYNIFGFSGREFCILPIITGKGCEKKESHLLVNKYTFERNF